MITFRRVVHLDQSREKGTKSLTGKIVITGIATVLALAPTTLLNGSVALGSSEEIVRTVVETDNMRLSAGDHSSGCSIWPLHRCGTSAQAERTV